MLSLKHPKHMSFRETCAESIKEDVKKETYFFIVCSYYRTRKP